MKLFNYSHKMVRDTGLWGFWSHHHLLLLPGHSFLFSGFRVQGSGGGSSGFAANHIWGDARRWYSSHQSLVTSHSAPLIPSHESPATHLKSDVYQSFCLLVFLTSHSFCAASTSSFLWLLPGNHWMRKGRWNVFSKSLTKDAVA